LIAPLADVEKIQDMCFINAKSTLKGQQCQQKRLKTPNQPETIRLRDILAAGVIFATTLRWLSKELPRGKVVVLTIERIKDSDGV